MVRSLLIEHVSSTLDVSKPIRFTRFRLDARSICDTYTAVRHSGRSRIRWNIIIWYFSAESARKVRPLSRESALVKGFRKTQVRVRFARACICLTVYLIYPLSLSGNDSRVRNLRTDDVCTRNFARDRTACLCMYAWMYSRTRRSS